MERLRLDDRDVLLTRGVVLLHGEEIRLTDKERDLLGYLARRPGLDVRREQLLEEVWGYHPANPLVSMPSAELRIPNRDERLQHDCATRGKPHWTRSGGWSA